MGLAYHPKPMFDKVPVIVVVVVVVVVVLVVVVVVVVVIVVVVEVVVVRQGEEIAKCRPMHDLK